MPPWRAAVPGAIILPVDTVVIGSGSWGTALAWLLGRGGHRVTLVGRSPEEIEGLRATRHNPRYLKDAELPASVSFSFLEETPKTADLCVIAVPGDAVTMVLPHLPVGGPLVIAAKGLEAGSGRRLSEVVAEADPGRPVGSLSGPNLAAEVVRGVPTVAVAAFPDLRDARKVQDAFFAPSFRVSVSDDLVGVELAGALKNVLAIGAGVSDGLGFGDNTKGAFLSRGLMEIARLGTAMGGRMETFLGPAGVGDLFATAASKLSRNHRVGELLGQGVSLSEAMAKIGQVAEGVPTAEAAVQLAKRHGVPVPVIATVRDVIAGACAPIAAVERLMARGE